MNTSNFARLKELFRRAAAGQELTIGFLGGSITQGSLSTQPGNAYAFRVYQWFVDTFPQSKFHYVNGGIGGTSSHYGVARAVTDVLMSWGMVFLTGTQTGIAEISRRSWLFLVLSGLATGARWLCYYHALQVGAASKVVPIDKLSVVITLALAFVVLHEPFTAKSLIGCALITAGTLFMVL